MIDKPAGLVVHPAPGHAEGTLVHALIGHCGESLSGIGGVRRPGIVHRLDKDTSGLLVVAKTDAAHQGLADLFADHGRSGSLTREYLALVWGSIRRLGGQGRRRDRPAWAPSREDGGRAGRARPPRGHPLAGRGGVRAGEPDRLPAGDGTHPSDPGAHGLRSGIPCSAIRSTAPASRPRPPSCPRAREQALAALGRQALHASTLGFEHPITGEPLRFESPPPPDLSRLIKALRAGEAGVKPIHKADIIPWRFRFAVLGRPLFGHACPTKICVRP